MKSGLSNLSHPDTLFIGGSWVGPATNAPGSTSSRRRRSSVSGALRGGSVQTSVDGAVAAAALLAVPSTSWPWPRVSGIERAVRIRAVADRLAARADDFAYAWSLQVGMPVVHSGKAETQWRGYLEHFAESAEQGWRKSARSQGAAPALSCASLFGVTVAVVPWNAPLPTLLLKVAPALAAGCAVIAKPSPETPLEALLLAECVEEAGLPGRRLFRAAGRSRGVQLSDRPTRKDLHRKSASPAPQPRACTLLRSAAAG